MGIRMISPGPFVKHQAQDGSSVLSLYRRLIALRRAEPALSVGRYETFSVDPECLAYGRSYGDSCLNEGGVSLDVSHLRRFISFDENEGLLCCEAGVSLAEILELVVPRGWFIPVSPGTKFVSVGGAIANDVHGKNHHRDGCIGHHVPRFELVRSNGARSICSANENADLYRATIAGECS